jgi:hypothetical protein
LALKTILKISITWDTDLDDEELEFQDYSEEELPKTVEMVLQEGVSEEDIDQEAILETLTEEYGFLIEGAKFEYVYEIED